MIKHSFLWAVSFLFAFEVLALPPMDEHERAFTEIYDKCVWGRNDNGEGFSGGGSLLQNTLPYIDYLKKFMKDKKIKSVVDAGCGDWEFSKYMDWTGVQYRGYDVVRNVIEKNKERFSQPNIQFFQGNFINTNLPSADLFLCKHVLQHLTNKDILLFLPQLSKYKYCLITNEVEPKTLSGDNRDTIIGGAHKLDLTKPPFNVKATTVLTYYIGNSSVHQVILIDNSKK